VRRNFGGFAWPGRPCQVCWLSIGATHLLLTFDSTPIGATHLLGFQPVCSPLSLPVGVSATSLEDRGGYPKFPSGNLSILRSLYRLSSPVEAVATLKSFQTRNLFLPALSSRLFLPTIPQASIPHWFGDSADIDRGGFDGQSTGKYTLGCDEFSERFDRCRSLKRTWKSVLLSGKPAR
jgi:hypothetical protein